MTDINRSVKRFLSGMLVLLLLLGMLPVLPAGAETAEPIALTETEEPTEPTEPTEPEPTQPVKLTLEELMAKFPEGKYWNGGDPDGWTDKPCTHHGSCGKYGWNGWCGCNSFNGQSIQCMGFAEKLGFDATGYNPRLNENGWKTKSYSSALNSLKAGDIVRRNGHSMYVIGVDGNTVTIADCNAINKSCNIRWGVTISKSNLTNNFEYVRSAPEELAMGYLGKCEDYPSCGSVTVVAETVVRTHPCTLEAYEKSEDVGVVPAGTVLQVTSVCKNTEGQCWYETAWEEKICYVPAETVESFCGDFGTVTIADVSAPVDTRKGRGFPIEGTVQSDTLPLTRVGAYIFEGDGVSDTPYMTSEDTVSGKLTYSIYGSAVDNNLTFGKLPLGNYTYLVMAEVKNYYADETGIAFSQQSLRLHQNTFTVSSSTKTHSFAEGVTTAPVTCGEDGILTFTCKKCGYDYSQTVFSVGEHTLGQWETVQQATCIAEGVALRRCTGCDHCDTRTLPVTDNHINEKAVYTAPTCTEHGYTALFCADCEAFLCYEDYEAALGHSYGQWTVTKEATLNSTGQQHCSCTRCDDTVTEEIPCMAGAVEGWSLTLAGELNMNFSLRIDENIRETAQVVITVAEDTYCYPIGVAKRENQSGTYRFSVPVAAAQMADTIRVQVVNGEDVGEAMEYTVLQYAQSVLADESLKDCHSLIREMLHYGAAAQQYFDYNAENPVNKGLVHTGVEEVPETWNQPMAVSGAAEGIRFYGASLVYRDKIAVRYYFIGSEQVETYSFRCGDAEYTPVYKDGLWYVELPGILIQDLDESLTLTVNDSLSVTYCPMHYVVRMNQKGTQQAKELVQAMYYYYLAAEEYLQTK